jgi:hypothetical protein
LIIAGQLFYQSDTATNDSIILNDIVIVRVTKKLKLNNQFKLSGELKIFRCSKSMQIHTFNQLPQENAMRIFNDE